MNEEYYLISFQSSTGIYTPETKAISGSLIKWLAIERELGRHPVVLFCKEITREEYQLLQLLQPK